MSINIGTAVGYIELDTSNFVTSIKTAGDQLQLLTNEGVSANAAWVEIGAGIEAAGVSICSSMEESFQNASTSIKQGLNDIKINSDIVWKEIETETSIITNSIVSAAIESFKELPGGVIESISTLPAMMEVSAGNALDGFIQGVQNGTAAVVSAAKALASSFMSSFNSELQINSPSKKMEMAGLYINEGLALGIEENSFASITAARNLSLEVNKSVMDNLGMDNIGSERSYAKVLEQRSTNDSGTDLTRLLKEISSGISTIKPTANMTANFYNSKSPQQERLEFETLMKKVGQGRI